MKGGERMTLAEKIRQLRAEKGISQTKLAQDIHISRSAVAKWENGLGVPGAESLQLLADYFGVPVEELIPQPEAPKYSDVIDIMDDHRLVKTNKWIKMLIVIIGCSMTLFLTSIVLLICLNSLTAILELLAVGLAVLILIGTPILGFVGALFMAVLLVLQLVKLLKTHRGYKTIGLSVFYGLLFFGILLGVIVFSFWVQDAFTLTTITASVAPCLMWCLIYVHIAFYPIVHRPEKRISILRTVACSIGFVLNLLLLTVPIQFRIFDGDFSGELFALYLLFNAILALVQALTVAICFVSPRIYKRLSLKES